MVCKQLQTHEKKFATAIKYVFWTGFDLKQFLNENIPNTAYRTDRWSISEAEKSVTSTYNHFSDRLTECSADASVSRRIELIFPSIHDNIIPAVGK